MPPSKPPKTPAKAKEKEKVVHFLDFPCNPTRKGWASQTLTSTAALEKVSCKQCKKIISDKPKTAKKKTNRTRILLTKLDAVVIVNSGKIDIRDRSTKTDVTLARVELFAGFKEIPIEAAQKIILALGKELARYHNEM